MWEYQLCVATVLFWLPPKFSNLKTAPRIVLWTPSVNTLRLFQVPECWQELGYCYKKYYLRNESYFYNWIHSLVWILVVAAIFLVMVFVYGYIIWIIYRVSLRNPGFRKKRSAVVTTMCLVISFVLSYIFYFIVHFYISVNQDKKTELYLHASQSFQKICPACNLMLDFLLTGMVGAIMDPIIYCARMKEIKLALNQICRTHGFSRQRSMSSTGYVRAVVHSTHSTVEHEMTEEPFWLGYVHAFLAKYAESKRGSFRTAV